MTDDDTTAAWVTLSRDQPTDDAPDLRPRRILAQLLVGLVVVLAVVGILGTLAAQRLAEREAVNDAAKTADVLATAVVQPALSQALIDGDPAAVEEMDAILRERVLGDEVVRLKLWSTDGTVLYADEPQLVGRTFTLSEDQQRVLSAPQTLAEVSDLQESENEFESGDRLVEVYRPVWTAEGTEVLFEMYSPYEPVQDRAGQLNRGFAGVMLSSLLLLVVLMAPILLRLLQRLRTAQQHRELLLERAVDASGDERRRIAASLHDGPVQELVATSYAVSAAALRAEDAANPALARELSQLSGTVRGSIRVLRTLLVDIYPPSLSGAGLTTALSDLRQTVSAKGVEVDLVVDESAVTAMTVEHERLAYRVAQECLRNVAEHAAPGRATVTLHGGAGGVVLEVADDGPGFDVALLQSPRPDHFGLRVLADLATEVGADLKVSTGVGQGTRWRLTLPAGGGIQPHVDSTGREHMS